MKIGIVFGIAATFRPSRSLIEVDFHGESYKLHFLDDRKYMNDVPPDALQGHGGSLFVFIHGGSRWRNNQQEWLKGLGLNFPVPWEFNHVDSDSLFSRLRVIFSNDEASSELLVALLDDVDSLRIFQQFENAALATIVAALGSDSSAIDRRDKELKALFDGSRLQYFEASEFDAKDILSKLEAGAGMCVR